MVPQILSDKLISTHGFNFISFHRKIYTILVGHGGVKPATFDAFVEGRDILFSWSLCSRARGLVLCSCALLFQLRRARVLIVRCAPECSNCYARGAGGLKDSDRKTPRVWDSHQQWLTTDEPNHSKNETYLFSWGLQPIKQARRSPYLWHCNTYEILRYQILKY